MGDPRRDELQLLGAGIKQLRRKHRFTQQELAQRCNIHYQFLGGIERGTENPTLDILGRIARALGVSLPELFSSSVPDEGNPAQIRKRLIEAIRRCSESEAVLLYRIYRSLEP
jgi:transcriptional regulator with XRE-family HTH domain